MVSVGRELLEQEPRQNPQMLAELIHGWPLVAPPGSDGFDHEEVVDQQGRPVDRLVDIALPLLGLLYLDLRQVRTSSAGITSMPWRTASCSSWLVCTGRSLRTDKRQSSTRS